MSSIQSFNVITITRHLAFTRINKGGMEITFSLTKSAYFIGSDHLLNSLGKNVLVRQIRVSLNCIKLFTMFL